MENVTDVACPVCNQPLANARARRRAEEGSLSKALATVFNDIDLWAEGDVNAADGHLLNPKDLAAYLANELVGPLMTLYGRKLRQHQDAVALLLKRRAAEQKDVDAVRAGQIPQSSGQGKRKTHCVRGHLRSPENVNHVGACIECKKAWR